MRCEFCPRAATGTVESNRISGLALCDKHNFDHPGFVPFTTRVENVEITSGTHVRINYGILRNEPGTFVGWDSGWFLVYPDSDEGREIVIRADGCLLLTASEFTVEDSNA
jgi:hypothetical protein